MKPWPLPLFLLLLSACQSGPQPTLYKAGSLPAERQEAYDQCKIRSFREIPQALVTEITPGYHDPGDILCDTDGPFTTCRAVGVIDIPATRKTRDANEGLRRRFVERCLADQGYQVLQLPLCPKAEDRRRLLTMPQPERASAMTCRPDTPLED